MGELTEPLRGSAAMAVGLVTRSQLRGPGFRRLFPDIYLPAHLAPTLALRSRGAHLLVAGHGALAGYSAAELLGARIAPCDADAEVVADRDGVSAAGYGCTGSNLPTMRSKRCTGWWSPVPFALHTTWPAGRPS